ncbi:MAG: hypothetical protein HOE45_12065 [Gammaproteobacteria bacterium]|jgi:hypothetical protein|uniref:DUF6164 family protein n=1 Tax=Methyloprofundus sp. TaxID=2020875 RepID=UPI0017949754|nr:DUF6164 family protein [Methyloprofundus sp.]MBT3811490.1 hypothetical protein [Gammaproteobacteria bacterium]HIL79015.1 hypothetical protein [Methylococcales bacterium]MBT4147584.1 hypothetical protein [Gammaproteobacteria bacterium]MBT5221756.1 hypothetical protein [Gammaproteobacteria bacterium]MBT5826458.1 hypothetical protein [Gammaproteobacteria bacterium]
MALLLFSLRQVPDDEAADIRELLEENYIDFYETNAGNWGISMPAIWLRNEQQHDEARHLIDEYQKERQIVIREEYARMQESGEAPTFLKNIWHYPAQTILFIAAIILVLYLSIKLVFEFGL